MKQAQKLVVLLVVLRLQGILTAEQAGFHFIIMQVSKTD